MKRPHSPASTPSRPKRPRLTRDSLTLSPSVTAPASASQQNLSIRDQAEAYRLATAIFPIDALTPVWKEGVNREINVPHKRRLCQAFRTALHRTDVSNALRVLCTKGEVNRMTAELAKQDPLHGEGNPHSPAAWPSFMAWTRVNPEPVELMAGNHRVEALREYLKDHNNANEGRWWLCDVYDRGE